MKAQQSVFDAPITGIIVFPKNARITRTLSKEFEIEQHQILVHIPEKLLVDSIRIRAYRKGITILSSDLMNYRPAVLEGDDEVKDLREQIDNMQSQIDALQDADERLQKQVSRLIQMGETACLRFGEVIVNADIQPDQIESLNNYLEQALAELDSRRREITGKINVIENQKLSQEQSLESILRPASKQAVHIVIHCAEPDEYEIEITYEVDNAGWEARYDMRLHEDELELVYLAKIRQATGQDWPPLRLSLSTQPVRSTVALPNISPWYVNEEDKDEHRRRMGKKIDKWQKEQSGVFEGNASVTNFGMSIKDWEQETSAEIALANVLHTEGAAYGFVHQLDSAISINGDGQFHQAPIIELRLPMTLSHVSVPQQSESVIWRTKLRNTSHLTLRDGHAYLYRDGIYLTDFELQQVASRQPFAVALGLDQHTTIRRRLVERISSQVGQGSSRLITYRYEIVAANYHNYQIELTIRDQIPVPLNARITIELTEAVPPPAEMNDLNIMKWIIKIDPGETSTLRFQFSLEHPASISLTGII